LAFFSALSSRRPSVLQSHLCPIPEPSLLVCSGEHVEQVGFHWLSTSRKTRFFLKWFPPASIKKKEKSFDVPNFSNFPWSALQISVPRLHPFQVLQGLLPPGGRHQGIPGDEAP
jgi:hypothetical protein